MSESAAVAPSTPSYQCGVCRNLHPMRTCAKFLAMSVPERIEIVHKYRYCSNCLAKSHTARYCSSSSVCRVCKKFHHTLLHKFAYPSYRSRETFTPPRRFVCTAEQQRREHSVSERRPSATGHHRLDDTKDDKRRSSDRQQPASVEHKVKSDSSSTTKNNVQTHIEEVLRSLQSLKDYLKIAAQQVQVQGVQESMQERTSMDAKH